MFKYTFAVLVIILMPTLVFAEHVKKNPLSGTWFIYGFALYQPLDRTITSSATNRQNVYKMGFNYGIGIGKDRLRLEFSKYMEENRFLAAFDFFPKYIATPYIGYVYGSGLKSQDSTGMLKDKLQRGDAVLGITFQPIKFFNIYAEYLVRDSFFFAGARVVLPYILK